MSLNQPSNRSLGRTNQCIGAAEPSSLVLFSRVLSLRHVPCLEPVLLALSCHHGMRLHLCTSALALHSPTGSAKSWTQLVIYCMHTSKKKGRKRGPREMTKTGKPSARSQADLRACATVSDAPPARRHQYPTVPVRNVTRCCGCNRGIGVSAVNQFNTISPRQGP